MKENSSPKYETDVRNWILRVCFSFFSKQPWSSPLFSKRKRKKIIIQLSLVHSFSSPSIQTKIIGIALFSGILCFSFLPYHCFNIQFLIPISSLLLYLRSSFLFRTFSSYLNFTGFVTP